MQMACVQLLTDILRNYQHLEWTTHDVIYFHVYVSCPFPASRAHRAALISISGSPQPDTSRSCKTRDTGLVHHVVCPFTPQLSLVIINRPRRDGTLSFRGAQQPRVGFELTILRSQVRHRYHSATALKPAIYSAVFSAVIGATMAAE